MRKFREQLSYSGKLKRSIYEILRDDLERHLIKVSLIDSYNRFKANGAHYRFVDKSELKPRSKKWKRNQSILIPFW